MTELYHHPTVGPVRYTPGVRHLAETAAAYWVIDVLACEFLHTLRREGEMFIHLYVEKWKGKLIAADGDGVVLKAKRIPFTDFPCPYQMLNYTWRGTYALISLPEEA